MRLLTANFLALVALTTNALGIDMPATIDKVLTDPAFRARIAEIGAEPAGSTVAEARAFVKSEAVKWREVVLKSGAKAE